MISVTYLVLRHFNSDTNLESHETHVPRAYISLLAHTVKSKKYCDCDSCGTNLCETQLKHKF